MELKNVDASDHYVSGGYASQHPDWHNNDAKDKALDIESCVDACVKALGKTEITIGDVGAGTGGVLSQLLRGLKSRHPNTRFLPIGFDVSPDAVEASKRLNPEIEIKQKFFSVEDGPLDIVTFNDVLEHLENPWEMLRLAQSTAQFLVVRQPLLGNYPRFRRDNYQNQRDTWGHIALFSSRSFADMTRACGWQPLQEKLLAPWELSGNSPRNSRWIHRMFTKWNRTTASFFVDGFYLVAAYRNSNFKATGR